MTKRKSGLRLSPKQIKRLGGASEGWWYEDKGAIYVYLRDAESRRLMWCAIPRAQLADWLRRTERPRPPCVYEPPEYTRKTWDEYTGIARADA